MVACETLQRMYTLACHPRPLTVVMGLKLHRSGAPHAARTPGHRTIVVLGARTTQATSAAGSARALLESPVLEGGAPAGEGEVRS